MESSSAREALILQSVRDPSSDFYKGLCRALRDATAREKAMVSSKPRVSLPFKVDERDEAALEAQFKVSVESKGSSSRARLTPRVAGMVACVDETLYEHAGGYGKTVLAVDADVVNVAVRGLEGRVIERTGATARLAAGYAMEQVVLEQMAVGGGKPMNSRARILVHEMANGGGEHFSPTLRDKGPAVDAIAVNMFRTPASVHQLAWLGRKREAVVFGAFPFQTSMLLRDSGPLECFPGMYYVDRDLDMITLVPSADATMSVSHPYSALMTMATVNAVTVEGMEYLVERYAAVPGIMYFTIKCIDAEFEAPESLRSYYYSPSEADITVLRYPKVKLSAEGVPVGWQRGEVRMLTSRYQKVLSRVMCSQNKVVAPPEVFVALMDYNNLVINTMDTAVTAERMEVEDEQAAALAIALHVNFRRHAMRGTLNVLLDAVKKRHAVAGASLLRLGWMALTVWFSRASISAEHEVEDLPVDKVLDWCGNDFSVTVSEANPWLEVVQDVGLKKNIVEPVYFSHMPKPPTPAGVPVARKRAGPKLEFTGKFSRPRVAGPVVAAVCVDKQVVEYRPQACELSAVKETLKLKMRGEQAAVTENPLFRKHGYAAINQEGVGLCPVPDVDPVSAIRNDLATVMRGLPERDAVTTGFRLAETDGSKETRGNLTINDAKRVLPTGTYVRRPKVDAGVEGNRVASQASLLGAVFKRNIGIPNNRGLVDLDMLPETTVDRMISVCFRDDWQEIVTRHLNSGMWQPEESDIDDFLAGVDETKARAMLDEFFVEGEVKLDRWMLMAKGKVKPSRDDSAQRKVDHAQTILYLENKSTNAMYSSMTRRFKKCLDECLRPEISLNAQESDEAHEAWYNSLESGRQAWPRTFCYASDMRCYDRAQEHPAMRSEMALYKRMGLDRKRFELWEQTHGPKKALSMAFGVIFVMVWGGVSGIWKTLLRNGLINLMAVVVCCKLTYRDIVMLDIKGDDMDAEFSRPVDVESAEQFMGGLYNMSAKFAGATVRYMCKQFRFKVNGKWYFVADPWPRVQSLCTPLRTGGDKDALSERWISLVADLRHYDNGILVDRVAELAQVFYGMPGCFHGMARGLAMFRQDKVSYCNFFLPEERVC